MPRMQIDFDLAAACSGILGILFERVNGIGPSKAIVDPDGGALYARNQAPYFAVAAKEPSSDTPSGLIADIILKLDRNPAIDMMVVSLLMPQLVSTCKPNLSHPHAANRVSLACPTFLGIQDAAITDSAQRPLKVDVTSGESPDLVGNCRGTFSGLDARDLDPTHLGGGSGVQHSSSV